MSRGEGCVLHREVGVFAGVTWREVSRPFHNMVPNRSASVWA
jgi:hypothetical protein